VKNVSKIYVPSMIGFSGGDTLVKRGNASILVEKTCGSGRIILSSTNAFDNNYIANFDNTKLVLQIVKYLVEDNSPVISPQFPRPKDEMIAYYNSEGTVGDSLKSISQFPGAEGKIVLGWSDYGPIIESYSLKSIADSASPASLIVSTQFYDIQPILKKQVALDTGYTLSSDDSISDLATFYATTNDSEALDTAKRLNASYLLFS